MAVNNQIYEDLGHAWWSDDEPASATIRFFINPVRFRYFDSIRNARFPGRARARLLDVGCGGGFLAEDFARTGLSVSGIDPSAATIREAKRHSRQSGLEIDYRTGCGEFLPYKSSFFDFVSCCDALEHVDDPRAVVAEISRVLKPGGLFFYDTINRTRVSRLVTIKIMQEWKSTAFAPPGTHDWNMFIRPPELFRMMEEHGLFNREVHGLTPAANPVSCFLNLRRAASGAITYRELGERMRIGLSDDMANSYIGYAVKAGK